MNKQENKYYRTASFMDEALIILLNEKDMNYITVKEICERAGVNRSTFYLHYESMDDLLNETLEYITKKFVDFFQVDTDRFISSLNESSKENLIFINYEYLEPYLEFIKENKRIFTVAFNSPSIMKTAEKYSNLEKYVLNPILEKYDIRNNKKKYILEFYVNGVMAIIKEWVTNDCKEDIKDIINIIIECVKP